MLEELHQKLAASRESGVSDRSVDEILAEARHIKAAQFDW
jgi:hypothetical protein